MPDSGNAETNHFVNTVQVAINVATALLLLAGQLSVGGIQVGPNRTVSLTVFGPILQPFAVSAPPDASKEKS